MSIARAALDLCSGRRVKAALTLGSLALAALACPLIVSACADAAGGDTVEYVAAMAAESAVAKVQAARPDLAPEGAAGYAVFWVVSREALRSCASFQYFMRRVHLASEVAPREVVLVTDRDDPEFERQVRMLRIGVSDVVQTDVALSSSYLVVLVARGDGQAVAIVMRGGELEFRGPSSSNPVPARTDVAPSQKRLTAARWQRASVGDL